MTYLAFCELTPPIFQLFFYLHVCAMLILSFGSLHCCSLLARYPLVLHLSAIPRFSYGSATITQYINNPITCLYLPLDPNTG